MYYCWTYITEIGNMYSEIGRYEITYYVNLTSDNLSRI